MRSVGRARIGVAVLAFALPAAVAHGASDKQNFEQIERGRYLTVIGDCTACHTVPGSNQPFAGGRPLETPFGTLLSPNITPDSETGIGAWTDEEFDNALRKGTGHAGEHLYPGMPYTYMTHTTLEDVRAIRAYLNTVQPVRNKVVANQLPFPFNVRASLIGWDQLYFKAGEFQPVPGKSAQWNRGAYIVTGLGHCGMCHTPKDSLGGDEDDSALQGYALQGWFAPDITNNNHSGLGGWSVEEIVAYLKTGHNRTSAASGPMGEEVALSSSQMTQDDLTAIAVYLKDQPGPTSAPPAAVDASDPRMQAGAAIYGDVCSACHAKDGSGVPGFLPALRGAPSVQQRNPASILHVIIAGTQSVATDAAPSAPAMPTFAWQLNDAQVAAVATYVRNAWGNAASAVTASDARDAREALQAAR